MKSNNTQSLEFVCAQVKKMQDYAKMLESFGISHFHYIKVTSKGEYIHLVDDEEYAKFYLDTITNIGETFKNSYEGGFRSLIWPSSTKDKLIMGARNFEIANGYTLTKFSPQYFEAWSFSGPCHNENLINVYIHYKEELIKFIKFFNAVEASLLREANNAFAKYEHYNLDHEKVRENELNQPLTLNIPYIVNGRKVKPTNQENSCLRYLSKGLTYKEIARTLEISPRTVETYIVALKKKFNVHTKSELTHIFHKPF